LGPGVTRGVRPMTVSLSTPKASQYQSYGQSYGTSGPAETSPPAARTVLCEHTVTPPVSRQSARAGGATTITSGAAAVVNPNIKWRCLNRNGYSRSLEVGTAQVRTRRRLLWRRVHENSPWVHRPFTQDRRKTGRSPVQRRSAPLPAALITMRVCDMASDRAREIGRALIAAADEIDAMTSRDEVAVS
jgi:hypothetical protein